MNERTQEEMRISAAGENFLNRTPISKEKRLILTTKCAYNGIIKIIWFTRWGSWSPFPKSFTESAIFGRPAMKFSFFAWDFFLRSASKSFKIGF